MTREALRRAGRNGKPLSHEEWGKRAGYNYTVAWQAMYQRLDPERASKLCIVLSDLAGLSASERREVFSEIIHNPGEERSRQSVAKRVMSEDPMSNLWADA